MPSDFKNKIAFLYGECNLFFYSFLLAVSLFFFYLFLSIFCLFSLSFISC